MRLLRVIRDTRSESGGPVEALLRSSEALIRRGIAVEVVSLDAPEEAASRGFSFPVTGLGRGVGRYGYNPRLTPWIKENARRFDAVILHGIWNYSSVLINFVFYIRILEKIEATLVDNGKDVFANTHIRMGTI